jgi:hypothetical protein
VDGHKLFHHPSNADNGQPSPVDYYVVRLWEDVQEVLPSLLEPVPADLVDHMTSDQDAWYRAGVEDAEAALDWYSSHFMYATSGIACVSFAGSRRAGGEWCLPAGFPAGVAAAV